MVIHNGASQRLSWQRCLMQHFRHSLQELPSSHFFCSLVYFFYWTGRYTTIGTSKMMQNYAKKLYMFDPFLYAWIEIPEILRFFLEGASGLQWIQKCMKIWLENNDIYNFITGITKAKTSITVDDHLHARVRELKGNAWEKETQGEATKGTGWFHDCSNLTSYTRCHDVFLKYDIYSCNIMQHHVQ